MTSHRPITLLHISDPQFGRNHRFGRLGLPSPDDNFDNLLTRIGDDLRLLRDENDLRPDVLVVTGDLAEWGLKSEFNDALRFLEGLIDILELPRDRVAIIPGNHDVNRKACEAYFNSCEADEEDPVAPFWPKWKHYARLFDTFYRDVPGAVFTEEQPWSLFEIEDLHLVVAGLNSTMIESHRDDDHYGHVGEKQLRWFAERLESYRDKEWLRIGAVHHNVLRGAKDDDENLRDADDLRRILGPHLNLVLHGHTHDGKTDIINNLPVLATGSTALTEEVRPEEIPNQYQILEIWPDRVRRWCREYAPGRKSWIGDNRASEKGDDWRDEFLIAFQSAANTFPKITDTGRKSTIRTHVTLGPELEKKYWELRESDGFLARVKKICRLREKEAADIERIHSGAAAIDYLRISIEKDGIAQVYPLGAIEHNLRNADLEAFLAVHKRYQRVDSGVLSVLVYGGERPSDDLFAEARRHRIRLRSFVEYQGLIDFRPYIELQNRRLENDPTYPPDLYVPQRLCFTVAQEEKESEALGQIQEWLTDSLGRFVLVLGDFGTGKTFLLHELARRLGEEDGRLTPILIEMRDLEKGRSLDELVAQHLARSSMERIDLRAFRYMLREGRIVLLFDGFDELALRVSYDRAGEHFKTLVEAADGDAKVVVTSRTQHFESDRQVRTVLGEQVALLKGHRITRLRRFDETQIRTFLSNRLGDETKAKARFELLDEVKDLLGLSHNPRMLGFISELDEDDLLAAKEKEGEITAAGLYQLLLDRWLEHEVDRQEPDGALPALTVEERWDAVTQLAIRLWQRTERSVTVRELSDEVLAALESLAGGPLSPGVATHQVGSGTLLIRDAEGAFSFLHQSVLEWLVARQAAEEIKTEGDSEVLSVREISPLMADFFAGLVGRAQAVFWARQETRRAVVRETAKKNALLLLNRLGAVAREPAILADQDLRGQDFSQHFLRGADFSRARLTDVRFVEADLCEARLRSANLRGADLSKAYLRGADLRDADLTGARLLGADLREARVEGAILRRCAAVGAQADAGLENLLPSDAALPDPGPIRPWVGTASPCYAVTWDHYGELVVTGHGDGSVRIWDAASGREIRRLKGHQNSVRSVAFSPDGNALASGSEDNTVRLWDPRSGDNLKTLEGHQNSVRSVAFSPDRNALASGSSDNTVRLWDPRSGDNLKTLEGHQNWVRSVAFSPDGNALASGSEDNTVRLWDPRSGDNLKTLEGHQNSVRSVAFSPDGNALASGSEDNTVRLWDPRSGDNLKTLEGHRDWVRSVAFSPDGNALASGSDDNTVRLWDPRSGDNLKTLEGHQNWVLSVAFSPDGNALASGSSDNTVRLWDPRSGDNLKTLEGHQNWVRSVAFSPDGNALASGSEDNTVRLWDPRSGDNLKTLEGHQNSVRSVAFSPDGNALASGSEDNTVRLWDPRSGDNLKTLEGHRDWVRSVAFSPDGNALASGSDDNTVRLWDPRSGDNLKTLEGHQNWVLSVAFSPDGNALASGSDDNTVRLWDPRSGDNLKTLEGHQNWVLSVAFSPDGNALASGSEDNTVRLWDPRSGDNLKTLEGHQNSVRSVAFSPDGNALASGSDDNTVRLWDPRSGDNLKTLEGHQNLVLSVAFSPDGNALASGSEDNTVRLWDVASGRCLVILGHLPEGWVAFTPDGRFKLGGEIDGGFWHSIGLCRFEPGELDPYLPSPLRVPDDEPLFSWPEG